MADSLSERVAIAAHLHVLLRRHCGRVTDVEWMASNREYALAVAALARAAQPAELRQLGERMAQLLAPPPAPVRAAAAPVGPVGPAVPASARAIGEQTRRYIGGVRW